MFNIDIAIKFGSSEIIIYRKGFGVIAKEPAYLAVEENGKNLRVKATGKEAEKMFLSGSNNVSIYQPIENGEIVNEKMATILFGEILSNAIQNRFMISKISALVAVPCALNADQLSLIKKVLHHSGISKVEFVQNAVCVRQGLSLDEDAYVMIVDIGKYITDISVLNNSDFNFGRIHFIGGADMDSSITTYIQDNHNVEISDQYSESIKNEVASLYERDMYKTTYIGIDSNNKFVKNTITANEVRVSITNVYDKICELIKGILTEVPKEVAAQVYSNGIVFVGGGSRVAGLYEYIKKKIDAPIIVSEDPTDSVIQGAAILLGKNKEFIKIEF